MISILSYVTCYNYDRLTDSFYKDLNSIKRYIHEWKIIYGVKINWTILTSDLWIHFAISLFYYCHLLMIVMITEHAIVQKIFCTNPIICCLFQCQSIFLSLCVAFNTPYTGRKYRFKENEYVCMMLSGNILP